MSSSITINCPVCNSPIIMEPKQLIGGAKFNCTNHQCDAAVSISNESQPLVRASISELEELKNQLH